MAISTYAELQTAIANWLNRSDLTSYAADFITLAEAAINRQVRHQSMVQRATATLDSQFFAIPTDWVETIRFVVTDTVPTKIELSSLAEMDDKRRKSANTTGRPALYAHIGAEFELYPTPDTDYTGELTYYGKIDALSGSNTTNWLLTAAPDVYLYGALTAAEPFLKNDERIAVWAGMYDRAVAELNSASERAQVSGNGLRLRIR